MKATKPEQVEVPSHKYRDSIQMMDGLSQEGFSQIAAIARLALISLETPEGQGSMFEIAHALEAIRATANNIQDSITHWAEEVGCQVEDAAALRRVKAFGIATKCGEIA